MAWADQASLANVDLGVFMQFPGPSRIDIIGSAKAGIDAGPFSADGHLMLDALFQFDPFAFDVRFSAGFHIRILG